MRSHSAAAFTLIELLVAIGIVAVLLAMLIPALAGAREQGKSIKCLSNLRQLSLAANVYCENYNGSYPIAYYTDGASGGSIAWDFTAMRGGSGAQIRPGLIWRAGEGGLQVQQCPSYIGRPSGDDPYTGYNYNTSYIGHGDQETIPAPMRAGQIQDGARTALFGDGQYYGGPDKFMRSPFPSPGDLAFKYRAAGTQAYRHQRRTNVVYCDGHAASVADRFTNTSDPAAVGPGTGFLSGDNSAYGG
ncbi:MAG TPA: prepilin-type N-terminal cleavage/methylation domain-containing protein [Tepidisphaeraceae bacterium]|nr:prepilin-type N-terminal cleavage/methylation domain-containing protein [Tepidisphaeraceae bacterium]